MNAITARLAVATSDGATSGSVLMPVGESGNWTRRASAAARPGSRCLVGFRETLGRSD